MIDAEVYLDRLWTQSLTAAPPDGFDLWVAPDIDVDTLDELPALTWNLNSGADEMNGPDGWAFTLNINVFGDGMDAAKAATRHVDSVVQAWLADPAPTGIVVDDQRIFVADGETTDHPTRLPSAELPGRLVVQYEGSYRLLLRWQPA